MRKPLLLASVTSSAIGAVALALAALGLADDVTLPLGVLACFAGLNALAGVLLLGQRIVMQRTSGYGSPAANRSPNAAPGAATATDRQIEQSIQALAWSIDARLVGLIEHLTDERLESGTPPRP